MSQLSEITRLPVNKTVVFYSPIEGRDTFVRTGTEEESFFHSFLHAYSSEYTESDSSKRNKMFQKLHTNITETITKEKWKKITLSETSFKTVFTEMVDSFYNSVKEVKLSDLISNLEYIELYQLMCDLVPKETFLSITIPVFDECNNQTLEKTKENITDQIKTGFSLILNKYKKRINEDKHSYFITKIEKLTKTMLDKVETKSFQNFSNLVQLQVDEPTISLLSDKFNRDIYFFDSNTRLPYSFGNDSLIKGRKSVIIMSLGNNQYQVVGRLLSGNKIQRLFEKKDPLIKRLNDFLFHPEVIEEYYPRLVPYLKNTECNNSNPDLETRLKSKSETHHRNSFRRSRKRDHKHKHRKSKESRESRESERRKSRESRDSGHKKSRESRDSGHKKSRESRDSGHKKSRESQDSGHKKSRESRDS